LGYWKSGKFQEVNELLLQVHENHVLSAPFGGSYLKGFLGVGYPSCVFYVYFPMFFSYLAAGKWT